LSLDPSSSRFMTPRERTGKPSSRALLPSGSRTSVPPFKVGMEADALLVFILPGVFPSGSAGKPSLPVPLPQLCSIRSLASPDRTAASASAPIRSWPCLSRERQPLRGLSPGPARLFERTPALGYGFPSGVRVRCRHDPPSTRCRSLCRSSAGSPLGPPSGASVSGTTEWIRTIDLWN
jgi:hypothetical protein